MRVKSIFNISLAVFLHIWFYVVFSLSTLVLSPFLFLSLLRKKDYPIFFWIASQIWARGILYGMGVFPKISNREVFQKNKSYMLVANHSSMLDIMLMYRTSRNPFVFIGKKELSRYPLFGFFYKKVSILVDRKSLRSKESVYRAAKEHIQSGYGICIFPEGGIPDTSVALGPFKDGAFRLSQESGLPIIPISFLDNKKRFPYNFLHGSVGVSRVIIHSPIVFQEDETDKKAFRKKREQIRNIILQDLI